MREAYVTADRLNDPTNLACAYNTCMCDKHLKLFDRKTLMNHLFP